MNKDQIMKRLEEIEAEKKALLKQLHAISKAEAKEETKSKQKPTHNHDRLVRLARSMGV